jgi:RimJ/RimL family protein N-acetyltransferase
VTTIEELTQLHFGLVATWLSDSETNRWLTAEWRNRAVSTTVLAIALRNPKNRFFLIRCNDQPCGLAALANIDPADATAMVWYVLGDPAFSKRGIASEAVTELVRKSFHELKLQSLYAWIMEGNAASAKVLRNVGFREVGRIRRAVSSNGQQVDRIYFDLIAAECP